MILKNAKILITGGSSGIGKAMAKMASEKGAKVLITGRDEAKLEAVGKELNVSFIKADVANEKEIESTFKWVADNWNNELDVLINNAGLGYMGKIEDINWSDFETMFHVNVFGAALMAKHATQLFRKQGKGNIVNVASTAGVKGFQTGTVYSASKFALRGMSQCWQAELRKDNIRVMLVNPSEVTTAFAQANREEREEVANKLTPKEIAHATFSALEIDDRGFIPELTVWASNPF